jgi:hypothetical protein
MTSQCLIASYRGDFVWLQHCLRSLKKFSEGFLPPVVAVNMADLEEARWIIQKTYPEASAFVYTLPRQYSETVQGFGMMRAMAAMLHGDLLCPQADNIFLVGSDCLATAPFRPEDYLGARGEPLILMHSYEHLRTIHPDAVDWRDGTAEVMGFTPSHEYMRRLPSVFHRSTFLGLREYVEKLHGMPFLQYWYGGYAAGQRGQSEANLLGAYAHRFQPDANRFVCLDTTQHKYPNALLQFWSHGGLEKPVDIHYTLDGHDVFGMKPRDAIVAVLGDCNDVTVKR